MKVVKRILLALFGLLSGLTGLVSVFVAVYLMVMSIKGIANPANRFMFTLFQFVISEVCLAFGIAALFHGLRCIFDRFDWSAGISERYWRRAVYHMLALPCVLMGCAVLIEAARRLW
ncbi:MAG TPA: hypothetical protein DD670_15790 [Planctomycetaceae bacterium]|nr:hypothetical protein [Planctomycetaceae bacterium]